MQQPSPPPTLDSSLNKFQEYNVFPENVVHPFASETADSISLLKSLLETTNNISESLSAYSTVEWTNPKVISFLRQGCNTAQGLYTSEKQSRHIISALRERAHINYGESIPLVSAQIPEWCISRLQNWCELAGLQAFRDDSKPNDLPTLIIGGKVIVVDIDFAIERTNVLRPRLNVSRVKTSYAIPSSQPPSTSLDVFLLNTMQAFCLEVQQTDEGRDPQKAAHVGHNVRSQLKYLVMLDQLTQRQHDGGLKWFTALDEVCPMLDSFAAQEAKAIAASTPRGQVPLDIFLMRSHALPIPYLIAPSLSFLVYVSPLVYLSLLRDIPKTFQNQLSNSISTDIPLPFLRSRLATLPNGATIATLLLTQVASPLMSPSLNVASFAGRPTFSLVPSGSDVDFAFPQLADDLMLTGDTDSSQFQWVLDFTDNGKGPGVVVSQSRMRDIELILNPLGGMGPMSVMGTLGSLGSFRGVSWVDLLLATDSQASEFYTATYVSHYNAHPALKLRLTTPEEPGFRLQKVPVHTLKEVWGVLEIVREQSWLNEILLGCEWKPESQAALDDAEAKDDEVTLSNILSGSYTPRHLPVNVELPQHNVSTEALFDDPLSLSRPKIVMTSPERPPITGLVEISISFDETKQRGVEVGVRGAVGMAMQMDEFEEVSRRGGTFSIPGRIWQRSHSSAN